MVRTFRDTAQLDIPYAVLCPVYFLRYPNPLATHVLSVDVLSREIVARQRYGDDTSGRVSQSFRSSGRRDEPEYVLRTTRLILKRGTLPKWAPAGILRNTESWVLEESEVELDGDSREMRCWTRNLDHTTVMAVTERNIFREQPALPASSATADVKGKDRENAGRSLFNTSLNLTYDVESQIGFVLLRNRIEKFGYNRVLSHIETSRLGLMTTYSSFLSQRNLPVLRALAQRYAGSASADGLGQLDSAPTKRQRLLAALRPPFLDGDYVGPIARLRRRAREVRHWWKGLDRGGSADKKYMWLRRASSDGEAHGEQHLTPMERLRKRFLTLRDAPAGEEKRES